MRNRSQTSASLLRIVTLVSLLHCPSTLDRLPPAWCRRHYESVWPVRCSLPQSMRRSPIAHTWRAGDWRLREPKQSQRPGRSYLNTASTVQEIRLALLHPCALRCTGHSVIRTVLEAERTRCYGGFATASRRSRERHSNPGVVSSPKTKGR